MKMEKLIPIIGRLITNATGWLWVGVYILFLYAFGAHMYAHDFIAVAFIFIIIGYLTFYLSLKFSFHIDRFLINFVVVGLIGLMILITKYYGAEIYFAIFY